MNTTQGAAEGPNRTKPIHGESPPEGPSAERESARAPGQRLARVAFCAGCAAVIVLIALYNWPRGNVPVYYFTVRPALLWFAGAGMLLGIGVFGVKRRWFLLGCGFWLIGLFACAEVWPLLRPGEGAAAQRFRAERAAYFSYIEDYPEETGTLKVPLRIVSWNIQSGGADTDAVLRYLEEFEPDLVLLQEARAGNMREKLQSSSFFRDWHYSAGGIAMLSRFPLQELAVDNTDGTRVRAWRIAVTAGAPILCVSPHLNRYILRPDIVLRPGWHDLEEAVYRTRRELVTMRAVVEEVAARGPVVLAGDFNLPPHYADLRRATTGFVECFGRKGYGWGGTAPAAIPLMRPDMVYVPRGSIVYRAYAVPTTVSDHYPVVAEVALMVPHRGTSGADGGDEATPPANQLPEEGLQ